MTHIIHPLKKQSLRNQITEEKLICIADGCDKLLTYYTGPGANKLCRTHQLRLNEWGGNARLADLYTLTKSTTCNWEGCMYDPYQNSKFDVLKDEKLIRRTQQKTLEVDHKIPQERGGDDSPENCWTLCSDHHLIKHASPLDKVETLMEFDAVYKEMIK